MSRTKIPSCLPNELEGKSLVDKILEIERDYTMEDERSRDWFYTHLECLSFHPDQGKVLRRSTRDPASAYFHDEARRARGDFDFEYHNSLETEDGNPHDFVAVSYCFESEHESLRENALDYEIHDSEGRFIKKFETRDIVLQRIMAYVEAVSCRHFWIDQECFDQNNEVERQAAMEFMDMVYNWSRFSVALLETVLESVEVDLMNILMSSSSEVGHGMRKSMVDMLKHVQQDKWWTRAWTLHEEYHAGSKMKLLIRHKAKAGYCIDSKLTAIEGEVCVPAFEFRQQATHFLERVQSDRITDIELQKACVPLLNTFRRYKPLSWDKPESNDGRAVTSAFADLARRNISESYDFLPIVANVYDWEVRLRSDHLARSPSHSAGLCALALYILNGEMFCNEDNVAIPEAGVGLSEYMSTISLEKNRHIPGGGLRYSRYKVNSQPGDNDDYRSLGPASDCLSRLPGVKLSEEGVVTLGHLWQIHTKIETSGWKPIPLPPSRYDEAYQRNGLKRLYRELKRRGRCDKLCLLIRHYLDEYINEDERESDDPLWTERDHMDTMAYGVLDAMSAGRSLYLAKLKGPREGCAIFALDNKSDADIAEGASVFTSLSFQHYVSMTVNVARASSKANLPLITTTGWTYAFAFTWGVPQSEMIIRWPKAWKWRNKRKLSGIDGDGVAHKSRRRC